MSTNAMDVTAAVMLGLIVVPFVALVWGMAIRFFLDWWRGQ